MFALKEDFGHATSMNMLPESVHQISTINAELAV